MLDDGDKVREQLWNEILELEENTEKLATLRQTRVPREGNCMAATQRILETCEIFDVAQVMPYRELRRTVVAEQKVCQGVPESPSGSAPSLIHYGVEVRHLPLAHFLPTAARFVSTRHWTMARDELKFIRIFDRALELHNNNNWLNRLQSTMPRRPSPPRTNWDSLLEEIWWMARDFQQESAWKRAMAKTLAKEAKRKYLLLKKGISAAIGNPSVAAYNADRELLMQMYRGDVKVYGVGSRVSTSSSEPRPDKSAAPTTTTPMAIDDEWLKSLREVGSLQSSLPSQSHREWTPFEDEKLGQLIRVVGCSASTVNTICGMLNLGAHGGRSVRSTEEVRDRIAHLSPGSMPLRDSSDAPGMHNRARLHVNRVNLMNSLNTKLITVRSTPSMPKKLNTIAHPSHEAAARKANQNISKLLTPQELAMRRIQRTRIITDPSGAIVSVPQGAPGRIPSQGIPPGSPGQRPVNVATYQAAVAAASAARPSVAQPSTGGPTPPHNGTGAAHVPAPQTSPATAGAPMRPTVSRPPAMLPNAALVHQQQRQALLNRSHQIGNYIATMQQQQQQHQQQQHQQQQHQQQQQHYPRPATASPLLKPPGIPPAATSGAGRAKEATTAIAASNTTKNKEETLATPAAVAASTQPASASSLSNSPPRIHTRRSSQAK